ncbi:MAG: tandem-95 repeat protein, partial [Acetobacteraceae bacterium]|nr:tandem-95 repeat protein [Acetobacteraceae bacterium]
NAGFSGSDSFTYTIAAIGGGTDTATITVAVAAPSPVNTPPVAGTDSATTQADTPVVLLLADLLANDSDADGNPLAITGIALAPAYGQAVFDQGAGIITYTPNAGFSGTDGFAYSLSDGSLVVPALVNVSVALANTGNTAPAALPDGFTGDEDTQIAGNVLANDLDADGDALTATLVAGVGHGLLVLNPDGSFVYTPAADFNGTDSFTYRASDGTASSPPAMVTLTVAPVNDPPVANDDAFGGPRDASIVGNVLVNDTDPENDPLTAMLVNGPQHGQLVLNLDGSFAYTPDAGFVGHDSFGYMADDGSAQSGTATVSLNVTAPPPVGGASSLAFSLWRQTLDDTTNLANARDPARNLDYTNETVPGEQASSSPNDSTGPHLARFLSTDGDVAVREVDFAWGTSVGPDPISLDWNGADALLSLDSGWGSIPLIRLNEFLGAELTVRDFAIVQADFGRLKGPFQSQDYDLVLQGAKTVSVTTAAGDDTIRLEVDSDGGTAAQNRLTIRTNDGNDQVEILASPTDHVGGTYDPAITRSIVYLGAGDDSFLGGDGSDIVTGGTGDDLLDGRGGYDIAVYSGNQADYALSVLDAASGLTTVAGPDGLDTLVRFEQLRFDDGVLKFQGGIWA